MFYMFAKMDRDWIPQSYVMGQVHAEGRWWYCLKLNGSEWSCTTWYFKKHFLDCEAYLSESQQWHFSLGCSVPYSEYEKVKKMFMD